MISTKVQLQSLDRTALIQIIETMATDYAELLAERDVLRAKIKEQEEQLRDTKRAKAPFSKGQRKPNPKRPGRKSRKAGDKGVFTNRPAPEPKEADQLQAIDVPLEIDRRKCPKCGCDLETHNETCTTEDIPATPARIILTFTVEVGACPRCGHIERGKNPNLGRNQNGANAHQVGPNFKAQALALHYHTGLPLRKVPEVMELATGIKITQSALTQTALTLSRGASCEGHAAGKPGATDGLLRAHYAALRCGVEKSKKANTDDTGWRINAVLAFLMGFFTQDTEYFQIRYRHRHQEVQEVVGQNYEGLLGNDRGPSYEAKALERVRMQKCLSHILKNLSEVEKTKTGRAKHFSTKLKETLKAGIDLWNKLEKGEITRKAYDNRGRQLEESLSHQLRDREMSDRDNQRLLDGLGLQLDKGRLTLFLSYPEIEPTNNVAERGLRGPVIARKVSHCSKNVAGAEATSVLRSIFGTLVLRTKNKIAAVAAFAGLLRGEAFPEPAKTN